MIYDIIATAVIPFVIQAIKKLKINSRLLPIFAIILAFIYVTIAKLTGLDTNLQEVSDLIVKALGISGASVLAYDTLNRTILNN